MRNLIKLLPVVILLTACHDYKKDVAQKESENQEVGSSRVDLQACKLEYSIVSPK